MASREQDYKVEVDDAESIDDEEANLNPSPNKQNNAQLSIFESPSNNNNNNDKINNKNDKKITIKKTKSKNKNLTKQPSLTRRLSSKFLGGDTTNTDRASTTMVDNIQQYVPDTIANHIPGLNRQKSAPKLVATYFCNICFTKYPINEGFKLTNCHHLFCRECLNGYFKNQINDGNVKIKCFYPPEFDNNTPCSLEISETDIHAIVTDEIWSKYEKFKSNLENNLSRQCPFCDHTQIGNPEHPMMACENAQCGKQFCLYHSNAHNVDETCQEYELRTAKENKMNEMAIKELGDDCKECPRCNFRIIKNGGCNHMNCVKCGCSFCWLCMEIIEDTELPNHYKDESSGCRGRQFEGMDYEPPPTWLVCVIYSCICLFAIPATILGFAFTLICFPFTCCMDCQNEDGSSKTFKQMFSGCWFIWLIILVVIIFLIPLVIFWCIVYCIACIYNSFRECLPCLPDCCSIGDENDGVDNVGGNDGNNNRRNQQFERVADHENEYDPMNDETVAINIKDDNDNDNEQKKVD